MDLDQTNDTIDMKRHNIISILSTFLLLLSFSSDCIGSEVKSNKGLTTTVILLRHVERDNFFIVTPEGHKRARDLVDAVGDMGITAIISPDLERNLDTVKPLANHLNLNITLTPRFNKQTIDKLIGEILAKRKGDVVLLVGNGSGNLRIFHQRLGGTGEGPHSYGDLFIYTIRDKVPVKVVKSRYGTK